MSKLIIFGIEETADVIDFYFRNDSDYEVVAFTTDGEFVKEDIHDGRPVIPFEDLNKSLDPFEHKMYVAIGQQHMNSVRDRKVDEAVDKGYSLASYVSSKASVWPGYEARENTFIMEENTIQPFAKIGRNTIVWSGNHVGHHSRIGDHCFISSHVVISGRVKIDDYSFLGVNSTLRDGIHLGEATFVGAGCLVTGDTEPEAVLTTEAAKLRRLKSRKLKSM